MKRCVSRVFPVLSLVLAGAVHAYSQSDYREQSLDLLRFLATEPWGARGHNRWDRAPRFHADLDYRRSQWAPAPTARQMDGLDEQMRVASTKRSAVATALNGRRRRQPTSSLGKGPAPYAGVDIINDLGSFLTVFRENVDTLGARAPDLRTAIFDEQPAVVQAPASGTGGGGTGMRRLHALRPLRPTGNIRTYNRRSFVEPETVYPGANHHDPGLLWTGLGR